VGALRKHGELPGYDVARQQDLWDGRFVKH